MVKPITLYSATTGLNTVLDPQRLLQGTKDNPGLIELAQAVNVSLDDRGLVSLRNGMSSLSSGSFHSLFCDGGDCFVAQDGTSDAAILRILSISPFTTAQVVSGLTKGARIAWAQTGSDTFYSNTAQKGYIRSGINHAWPIQTYQGPEADLQFATEIPAASNIAFIPGGKVLISVGPAVFQNHSPYQYGLFHPARGNVATFEFDVTMLAAVNDGFFASNGKQTYFFRSTENWYLYRQELAEDAPALQGSLAHGRINLTETLGEDRVGFGRVWTSNRGICVGTDDGKVVNLTQEKIVYPGGYSEGACLIKDSTVLHTAN